MEYISANLKVFHFQYYKTPLHILILVHKVHMYLRGLEDCGIKTEEWFYIESEFSHYFVTNSKNITPECNIVLLFLKKTVNPTHIFY
jgi:hypothetical protein